MPQWTKDVTPVFSIWEKSLSQPEPSQKFADLLLQARAGDSDAQTRLCQEYERQVFIVVRVLLGPMLRPHLDSIDVVQSVHRSLLAGIRNEKFEFKSSEGLISLACTMVRRKVARKWRKLQRQKNTSSLPCESQLLSYTLRSLYSRESSPSDLAQYDDSLEKRCESLNPVERQMLKRKLEGYTTGEVAQQLGLHPVTVRVRWSRLRERLAAQEILLDGM
jgi:RNA polymerase sigma factor (sigma-70 family)